MLRISKCEMCLHERRPGQRLLQALDLYRDQPKSTIQTAYSGSRIVEGGSNIFKLEWDQLRTGTKS